LDSFPAKLSYRLHLLIGFDAVEVDHGGRLSAMGGVGPLVVAEGDPAPDAFPVAGKGKGGRLLRRPQRTHPAASAVDFLSAVLTLWIAGLWPTTHTVTRPS